MLVFVNCNKKCFQSKQLLNIMLILILLIFQCNTQQESVQQTFLNKLQMKQVSDYDENPTAAKLDVGYHFTTLSLQSNTNSDASVRFLNGETLALVLALFGKTGSFSIRNSRINIIESFKNNEMYLGANYVEFNNSVQVKKNVKVQMEQELKNGENKTIVVSQWKLFLSEDYWSEPVGWDGVKQITTCGGVNMLGGYGVLSNQEIKKKFNNLPEHTQIRIIANYHFIDAWTGEMGYMKLDVGKQKDLVYVWTDKHNANKAKNGINVCGSAAPENKLSQAIDVIHQHIDDSIVIVFGSKLDQDPQMSSYGISSLQIYLR